MGYGALIGHYNLTVPVPYRLSLISEKNRKYALPDWVVLGPSYRPAETLPAHLTFALKNEGIDLLFFKKLFEKIGKDEVVSLVRSEYSGQYMRKIWFLYEWLMREQLPIDDLKIKNFIPLVDEDLQFASVVSTNSGRHRIRNNLPGTVAFCPMVSKVVEIERYIAENLSARTKEVISGIHKDILLRTSAFLLLKDSKASFTIEGENPTQNRAVRWGRAIGQAGSRPLSKEELLRLQQIVIENSRFTKMGYRTEGGFVGEHDRATGEPTPEHISARWQDLEGLMDGLMASAEKMEQEQFHPVLTRCWTWWSGGRQAQMMWRC